MPKRGNFHFNFNFPLQSQNTTNSLLKKFTYIRRKKKASTAQLKLKRSTLATLVLCLSFHSTHLLAAKKSCKIAAILTMQCTCCTGLRLVHICYITGTGALILPSTGAFSHWQRDLYCASTLQRVQHKFGWLQSISI